MIKTRNNPHTCVYLHAAPLCVCVWVYVLNNNNDNTTNMRVNTPINPQTKYKYYIYIYVVYIFIYKIYISNTHANLFVSYTNFTNNCKTHVQYMNNNKIQKKDTMGTEKNLLGSHKYNCAQGKL